MFTHQSVTNQMVLNIEQLQQETKKQDFLDLSFIKKADNILQEIIDFTAQTSRVNSLYETHDTRAIHWSFDQQLVISIQEQAELIQKLLRQALLSTVDRSRNTYQLSNRISLLLFCLSNSVGDLHKEMQGWSSLPLFSFLQDLSGTSNDFK